MPPLPSSSRALARLLPRRRPTLHPPRPPAADRPNRIPRSRFLTTGLRPLPTIPPAIPSPHRVQTRAFLGCGDGEEGGDNVLSKKYEERRVIGYSPDQLFSVVAAVDLYEDFVPWCRHSKIIRRNADGSMDAELQVGFKFLVESYISHVEMDKPKRIKVASMFFKEVVSRLVGSFSDRCSRIYGPAVQVLENSYGQAR